MSDTPTAAAPRRTAGTGWGGKALLVFAMAVAMAIPGLFVFVLVTERTHRAGEVTREVSQHHGGPQQVLGPVLLVPYTLPNRPRDQQQGGWYVISPETGTARARIATTSRHRGLFDVPVYVADIHFDAVFASPTGSPDLPSDAQLHWDQAQIAVGVTNPTGFATDVTGRMAGAEGPLSFQPAGIYALGAPNSVIPGREYGGDAAFSLQSVSAASLVRADLAGRVSVDLRLNGAQRFAILPFAKSTRAQVTGDWPAPSFDGGMLPANRALRADGFTADWIMPFVARGLAGDDDTARLNLAALGQRDFGITFARINDPYQAVGRSLKYSVMFVGLVFLTFFVFEALSGRRLHPAQYALIGLAQMIFYLLLLSLAEIPSIGFDWAFAIAATATVALIGLYAGPAFQSRLYQLRALGIFALLYALIYALMRLEDFGLLVGSIASFLGLAAAMWLTRNLDWYAGRALEKPQTA
jgi:inner membrane protein